MVSSQDIKNDESNNMLRIVNVFNAVLAVVELLESYFDDGNQDLFFGLFLAAEPLFILIPKSDEILVEGYGLIGDKSLSEKRAISLNAYNILLKIESAVEDLQAYISSSMKKITA